MKEYVRELRLQPGESAYQYRQIIRMAPTGRLQQQGKLIMPEKTTKGTDPVDKQMKLTPQKQEQNQKQMITKKPPQAQKSKNAQKQKLKQKQQETSMRQNQGRPAKMKYLQVPTRTTKRENEQYKKANPTKNSDGNNGSEVKTRSPTPTCSDHPRKYPPGESHPSRTNAGSEATRRRNAAENYRHTSSEGRKSGQRPGYAEQKASKEHME